MNQREMFLDALRHVAKLCAVAAMTAPKSGGQLFIQGAKPFIETVIVEDKATLKRLADWLREQGQQNKEAIWYRDAEIIKADLAVALSMSVSHKNIFFDKKMPEVEFSA